MKLVNSFHLGRAFYLCLAVAGLGCGDSTGTIRPAKYIVSTSTMTPAAGETVVATAQLADANDNPIHIAGRTVFWGASIDANPVSKSSLTNADGIASSLIAVGTKAGV